MPEMCLSLIEPTHVLALAEAIPQLVGFSREADEALEELQEAALSLLSTILYAYAESGSNTLLKQKLSMWLQPNIIVQGVQTIE